MGKDSRGKHHIFSMKQLSVTMTVSLGTRTLKLVTHISRSSLIDSNTLLTINFYILCMGCSGSLKMRINEADTLRYFASESKAASGKIHNIRLLQ